MSTPAPVLVETLYNPVRYSPAQINRACAICRLLDRGKLILCVAPERMT